VISGSAGDRRDLEATLRRNVRGEVRFDAYSRHLFSRDASMYAIEPIGVLFPRDGDDVAAVVATAGDFGVPVLPRGAGTSLAGQTVGHAVVMDLSRAHEARAPAGDLVFLADSFTTFTEASVGRAAITLLRLAGWRVRLEDAGCCARASLSMGLIDQARRMSLTLPIGSHAEFPAGSVAE